MAGNGKKAATYKQYLKICNTYNISAFTPKKDTRGGRVIRGTAE